MNIHGVQAYIQAERLVRNPQNKTAQQQLQKEPEQDTSKNVLHNKSEQQEQHELFTRNGRTKELYSPKGTLFDKVG
jgi:hypothetical protein